MIFKNCFYKADNQNFIYDDTIYPNGSIILLKRIKYFKNKHVQANIICIGKDGKNYVLSIQFPRIRLIPLKYFIEITTNDYSQIDILCLNQREQKLLDTQTEEFLKLMYNLEDIIFERDIVKFSLTYFYDKIFNEDMSTIIRLLFKRHSILYIYEKLGLFNNSNINHPVQKFYKIFSHMSYLKSSYLL